MLAALGALAIGLGAPAFAGANPTANRSATGVERAPDTSDPGAGGADTTEPESPCPPDAADEGATTSSTTPTTTTTTTVPDGESTTTTLPDECLPPCDELDVLDGADATNDPNAVPTTTTVADAPASDDPLPPEGKATCRPIDPEPSPGELGTGEPETGAPAPDGTAPEVAGPVAPAGDDGGPSDPVTGDGPTVGPEPVAEPAPDPEPELPASSLPTEPEGGWPIRTIAFPVYGPVRFDDDWGACRGGSTCPRRHIGNDVIGARLQPLVAAATGVVTHLVDNHPTAGYGLVITDADGWDYRYYHVNNDTPGTDDAADDGTWRFVTGLGVGSAVVAGQVVAFMGDSGNAETSVPHLHFEIHQPDGSPINPHQSLRVAEWAARCGGASDPQRDSFVPIPYPESATTAATIAFGRGRFLVGPDGSWASIGDARRSGDDRHVVDQPLCTDIAQPDPAPPSQG